VSLAEPAGVVSVDSGGLYASDFQAGCWQSRAVSLRRASAGCEPHSVLLLLLLHLALLPIMADLKKELYGAP